MRITPQMLSTSTLTDIDSSLAAMQHTSEELSSGKTILQPSDDPYGASRVVELQSQLDGLGAYATTTQEGISWENTASTAMSNIGNVLQTVRQLLVQASSGTLNQGDRENIAAEVQQLTEAVKQDANVQYAGQYVFSGTKTTTAPYGPGGEDEYRGDGGVVTRAVAPGVALSVSTDISSLLGNGQASGDGKLLDTLRTITEHLRGGSTEDLNALASTDLSKLEAGINTLGQLQAVCGSTIDQLQTAAGRIEGLQGSISTALSNTQDTNIAQASLEYSNEQAAFQAALRAGASIIQESLLQFLQ